MMPLIFARPGQRVKIVSVSGGRGFVARLSKMGLQIGSVVEVVQAQGAGPVIVKAGNIRIGIGIGMAGKILVTEM